MSDLVNLKAIKFVFDDSRICKRYKGEKAKTGWLEIKIMCQSGVTCISADYCFSELACHSSIYGF